MEKGEGRTETDLKWFNNHKLGSHKMICGKRIIMMMQRIFIAQNGSAFIESLSRDTPDIPEETKRFSPNGGVEKPMAQQHTKTTPKWMGSTPRVVMTGSSTGVTNMMMARVSMNMPRKSRKTVTIAQITRWLDETDNIPFAMTSGIRYWTRSRPNE